MQYNGRLRTHGRAGEEWQLCQGAARISIAAAHTAIPAHAPLPDRSATGFLVSCAASDFRMLPVEDGSRYCSRGAISTRCLHGNGWRGIPGEKASAQLRAMSAAASRILP